MIDRACQEERGKAVTKSWELNQYFECVSQDRVLGGPGGAKEQMPGSC